ncbi:hypothetical protein CKM354_000995900 [Cercospora kikuchii]|uniref:FAD-binding PCMH-type domain-containing protein n=1 Tax=Cercospora kikuchii TaxID=84275 RepID=A0A9P3CUE8_9PEZI|nr:uncharacterized protein CKM354_000995900 [Cercospora kikuchii]GIZ46850.1 hypothetical protein CKM354_000995900 [Cercospora kikuchii]
MKMKSLSRNYPLEFILLLAARTTALETSFLGPNPCCEALYLSPHIPSPHLHYPGETSHRELQTAPQYLNNHRFTPSCFYTPNGTDEVAQAIKILLATNKTTSRGCKFSIRSGNDHSAGVHSSQSNIDIMMDIRKLNSLTYHSTNDTLSVGPGATWREVHTYLSELPRSASHSRNDKEDNDQTGLAPPTPKWISTPPSLLLSPPSTTFDSSISDFFLSCAPAISSPQRSFSCDSVTNYEVVLGDGGWLVNANPKQHSELYKGLQAGANLGVVTKFDLQVSNIEQGEIWGGVVKYPESTAEEQFKALVEFVENMGKLKATEGTSAVVMEKYSSSNGPGKLEFWNAYTHIIPQKQKGDDPNTKPAHPPTTLQPFLSIPHNTSSTTKRHLNPPSLFLSSSTSSSQQPRPKTHYLKTFTLVLPTSSTLLLKAHHSLLDAITALEETAIGSWTVSATYQPFLTITSDSKSESTAILYEAFFEYQNLHGKPSQDGLFRRHAEDLRKGIEGEVEEVGGKGNPKHAFQSPAADLDTLREIAARYDPEGVFKYMVPSSGGFGFSGGRTAHGEL